MFAYLDFRSLEEPVSTVDLHDTGRKGVFFLDTSTADSILGLLIACNAVLVGIQVDIGDEVPLGLTGML